MNITFDPVKDAGNQAKHGVSLALAARFDWPNLLAGIDDRADYRELREIGFGVINERLYCVVFTQRSNAMHIARPTNARYGTMSTKAKIIMPTDEEDAAIQRGIAADPDTYEVSAKEMQAMKPLGKRSRGRPKLATTKELVSIRYDADVLDAFRASGEGWQTLMNATLNVAIQQVMDITYVGGPLHGTTVRDNPDTLSSALTYRPVTAFANDPAHQATYRRVTLERVVGNDVERREFFVSERLTDGEADSLTQRDNLWPVSEPHHA